MSSTSHISAVGLQGSEIQAATSVAYPELPSLNAACNKLIDLICTGLSQIPLPGSGLIASVVQKLLNIVKSEILRLKEHMLNALSKSHTAFSEICKNFSEAKGVKESFKALGNILQWAIGKGLYGLALACTKVLGWLIACNEATVQHGDIREYLTNLKRDFETAMTFEVGKTAVMLSVEQNQTNEHQVTVAENTTSTLQSTASLAEKSDATHDVTTREQRILEQIQQLLANEGGTAIQQMPPLETENELISFLLSLVDSKSTPERLLIILSCTISPQNT
jgi:hypothetical protein